MSETAFFLAPDLTLAVTATERLSNYFYEQFGAKPWKEESEAARSAEQARDQVLERAGLNIQKLFQQTGNLAVVGDNLWVHTSGGQNARLTITSRRLDHDIEGDYQLLFYFICLEN